MLSRLAIPACALFITIQSSWAVNTPSTPLSTPSATSSANSPQAPISRNTAANPTQNAVTALQQKHKQELVLQQSRLDLLEQANQTALSQNQELQLKNDSLSVQVQVLQSERSAQMFLYGAATFGGGIFIGIIIYNIISSRRRRQW